MAIIENRVALAEPESVDRRLAHGVVRLVGPDRALRGIRGARGVVDQRPVRARGMRADGRVGHGAQAGEQVVGRRRPGRVPCAERDPWGAARRERAWIGGQIPTPEHRPGRHVVKDLAHVLLADLDVDRVHDDAGAQGTPEHGQPLDSVVGEQRDPVAGADALARQQIGEAPRQVLEGAEGDSRALVGDLDEDLVGAMAGMLLEPRVEVGVGAGALGVHRGDTAPPPAAPSSAPRSPELRIAGP